MHYPAVPRCNIQYHYESNWSKMAAQSEEPGRIQFADSVQSRSEKHQAMAGVGGLSEKVSSQDLDDLDNEEKARKIAEEDLSQKRKQVRRPPTLFPVAIT